MKKIIALSSVAAVAVLATAIYVYSPAAGTVAACGGDSSKLLHALDAASRATRDLEVARKRFAVDRSAAAEEAVRKASESVAEKTKIAENVANNVRAREALEKAKYRAEQEKSAITEEALKMATADLARMESGTEKGRLSSSCRG